MMDIVHNIIYANVYRSTKSVTSFRVFRLGAEFQSLVELALKMIQIEADSKRYMITRDIISFFIHNKCLNIFVLTLEKTIDS